MRVAALLAVAALLLLPALAGCLGGSERLDARVVKIVHVDPDRWSGEPSILAMRDGTLLITGAGGMTRYAEYPHDIAGNAGQSYLWRSADDGDTWHFVDLGIPCPLCQILPYRNLILGVEGDLAQDEVGRAYFVDLSFLVGNGLARSDDSGQSWSAVQNPLVGQPGTDRPWVAAYGDGQVYVKYLQVATGYRVARSDDAGQTFVEDVAIPACSQADLAVDLHHLEVLIPCTAGGALSFLRTGPGAMAWEQTPLLTAGGTPVNGTGSFIFPAMAAAAPGHYVFVWAQPTEWGAEVRISASTDRGQTWSPAKTLSAPGRSAVFPWVAANGDGIVGAVWYESDRAGDPDAEAGEWRVMHASMRLHEPGGNDPIPLSDPIVLTLTPDPIHVGAICTSGLACVLEGRSEDRRLLDFFEVDVDERGRSHITWTNTRTHVPTIWYAQVATTRV